MTTEDEGTRISDLSCTFCGPGTRAVWDVVIEEGVWFVCDRHHVEMSEVNLILLERMIDHEAWNKVMQEGGHTFNLNQNERK